MNNKILLQYLKAVKENDVKYKNNLENRLSEIDESSGAVFNLAVTMKTISDIISIINILSVMYYIGLITLLLGNKITINLDTIVFSIAPLVIVTLVNIIKIMSNVNPIIDAIITYARETDDTVLRSVIDPVYRERTEIVAEISSKNNPRHNKYNNK